MATAPLLDIGDDAPAVHGATWQKGQPIEEYVGGKVYVIDFWATWCTPRIKAMSHLEELSQKYQDRGLVVIAVTSVDESNPEAAVRKYVDKLSGKVSFSFAAGLDGSLDKNFMKSANQQGEDCLHRPPQAISSRTTPHTG